MATLASARPGTLFISKPAVHYNKLSIASFILSLSFVGYFLTLAANILILHSFLRFSLLFVVCAPLLAGICAVISLRQLRTSHEHGMTLSYIALLISALYVTAALSLGFVLISLYIIYAFII